MCVVSCLEDCLIFEKCSIRKKCKRKIRAFELKKKKNKYHPKLGSTATTKTRVVSVCGEGGIRNSNISNDQKEIRVIRRQ